MGSKNKSDFGHYLTNAIDGCDYVLSHTTPDFHMRGEVHYQKGQALWLRKKYPLAATEFQKAIQTNQKLPKAYSLLVDYYIKANNKRKALEIVTEGLKHNPNTRSLQRRYDELGGKQPYPEPYVVEAAPPPEAIPQEKITESAQQDVQIIQKTQDKSVEAEKAAPQSPNLGEQKEFPSTATPPKGAPKNPYCRFCP
jgi:tetratricopeptide (TPR) repeat protein